MRWPWSLPVPGQNDPGETPLPRSWRRRHWKMLTSAAAVIVLAGGGVGLSIWKPWAHCGPGLSPEGSECVGLDLDSSALSQEADPLSDLEQKIAKANANVHGSDYVTIVYLDDMEPSTYNDSVSKPDLRDRVEGAIAAQQEANGTGLAGAQTRPQIKLLLANYGIGAQYQDQAVTAINANRAKDHIAAVTGIGQSLIATKQAIDDLSADKIITVGSITSADDLNQGPDGKGIAPYFFRVTSTDLDEARVAASFIGHKYKKIMLIQDSSSSDDYVKNLGDDVGKELTQLHLPADMQSYSAPSPKDTSISRKLYIKDQIPLIRPEICNFAPDLIYFAGRGDDLRSFLTGLALDGACRSDYPDPRNPVTVLSGDDASTAAGSTLPEWGGVPFKVFYTAIATGGEWSKAPADTADIRNYGLFLGAFNKLGFHSGDLVNGHAMMTYDAVLTAAQAARNDPEVARNPGSIPGDPGSLLGSFKQFTCDSPVNGASGRVAFYPNKIAGSPGTPSPGQGNPIDRAIPIMRIQQNGTPTLQDLDWSDLRPFGDPSECGGGS